jgi:hypothetical protein
VFAVLKICYTDSILLHEMQPRTCDLRVAELKRQKLERKMKRQAELDRRDAEYVEKAKEMAVKRRQEIKESENHLAESKERVRKKREKRLQKFEEVRLVQT